MNWKLCSEELPKLEHDCTAVLSGIDYCSNEVVVLYPKDSNTPGANISTAFMIQWDTGVIEWSYYAELGGIERCAAHGGPVPVAWMPIPPVPVAIAEGIK